MDNENKVAGVGPKVSSEIAASLAAEAQTRAQAILDAQPKVEIPQPKPEIAAAAEALGREPEKPAVAVWDHKSEEAKKAKTKATLKMLKKVGIIVAAAALVGGVIFLIAQAVTAANFAETKTRAAGLYAIAERASDDEGSCMLAADEYANTKVGEDTYSAYIEACRADMTQLSEKVAELKRDSGVQKDTALNNKWKAFLTSYEAWQAQMAGAMDFYEAAHKFLVNYEDLKVFDGGEEKLAELAEVAKVLTDAEDEKTRELGEKIVTTTRKVAESFAAAGEIEKALVVQYGGVEAGSRDPRYQEFLTREAEYKSAKEEWDQVAAVLYKGGPLLESDTNIHDLAATMYDRAGALKAIANSK